MVFSKNKPQTEWERNKEEYYALQSYLMPRFCYTRKGLLTYVLDQLLMKLILFNKPFNVMCQFSAHETRPTLADYLPIPHIYPAGRLDADSEGLVLLTDNGQLQHEISHPNFKQDKTYLVQVEGLARDMQLAQLKQGVHLGDFTTLPCQVIRIEAPEWLWERIPPIRQRANIPTTWLSITLKEGKNRQVRRMTAHVGLPTLRLIRFSIGEYSLASHPMLPGEYREIL